MPLPAYVCLAVIGTTWLLTLVTREYSWTDRLWAVMPPVYAWMFAYEAGFAARSVLMALLATAWGARLTWNFWRKGGFAPGGEDYRWAILRARMPRWAWELFNLTFVNGYQNLLVFLFTLPAWVVAEHPEAPLNGLDLLATILFVGALVGETRADQDQWEHHQRKKRGPVDAPFCTTGLFRHSRHPNYFFEQAQWWIYLLFPVAAGAGVWHLGAIGAPLLTLLFEGSWRFTEAITLSKYPSYAAYQRRTSPIVPWFPREE
jgi:steroid 5-alpha reductase family enzyme